MEGSSLEQRSLASMWAQAVLKDHPRIKIADRPYVEAVLVEAAMQEYPIKELAVGINDCGAHYKITIKGYKNLLDDVLWVNAFMGKSRSSLLDNVTKSYTQLTELGAIKVIQVNKVTMSNHHTPRSGRDHDDNDEEEEAPPVPASSARNRFKKRD